MRRVLKLLFNDNLASGGSLNAAILSRHVELSKKQQHNTTNSWHKA